VQIKLPVGRQSVDNSVISLWFESTYARRITPSVAIGWSFQPRLDRQFKVLYRLVWGRRGMSSRCFRLQFCSKRRREGRNDRGGLLDGLPLIGILVLAGCSLAPFITEQSIDYNSAVETVTNSVLVTNILRARDAAPLYFSDLSQIRGSVQLNLQAQTTFPFGGTDAFHSTQRASAQTGPIAVNSQPGFDFAPLNTKKFAQGILNGIDVRVFSYFIQRGIDSRIFLNLVVSRVERFRKLDDGYSFDGTCTPYEPHCSLPRLIESWTANRRPSPKIGTISTAARIGPPIPTELFVRQKNALGDLVQASAAKLEFQRVANGYQLSKPSVNYVLCVVIAPHREYEAVGIASPGATKEPIKPPVPKTDGTCSNGSSDPYRYVLYLRSVEAMFYYLGNLLVNPGPIQFHIYDHPVEDVRFRTYYRGQTYYVREAGDDQTLTILAILNDLLNLNRDAEEIPSTKTVATTP
jgi:hypothetical protein